MAHIRVRHVFSKEPEADRSGSEGLPFWEATTEPPPGMEAAQMTTRQEMVGAALCSGVITEAGSKLQSTFTGHTALFFGYFPATYKCKNILSS